MHTATDPGFRTGPAQPMQWFARAEEWLDARGKGAWIALMVLAFIFVWPIGLALLAFMIWRNKMSCSHASHRYRHGSHGWGRHGRTSSGNTAFDAYRDETLKRLEEEQEAFKDFLDRLRRAKDQTEFDSFMAQQKNRRFDDGEASAEDKPA